MPAGQRALAGACVCARRAGAAGAAWQSLAGCCSHTPGGSAAVPGCKARGRWQERRAPCAAGLQTRVSLCERGGQALQVWPARRWHPPSLTQSPPPPLPPACLAARDCSTATGCQVCSNQQGNARLPSRGRSAAAECRHKEYTKRFSCALCHSDTRRAYVRGTYTVVKCTVSCCVKAGILYDGARTQMAATARCTRQPLLLGDVTYAQVAAPARCAACTPPAAAQTRPPCRA